MERLNLKEKYKKEVIPAMKERFGYKNDLAVPKIEKVTINTGFGRMAVANPEGRQKLIQYITETLGLITGQKPVLTKARKAISSFKLRKGMPIGAMVTLRGKRMYDFLEKLIGVVLPRVRDFKGIPLKSFDEKGNVTIGFREYLPFPEISAEKERAIFGLEVNIATTSKNKEEGIEFLRLMGFPIEKENK